MNRKLRRILGIAVLAVSPLVTVAALGIMYVAVHLIAGNSMLHSVLLYKELISSLMPYSPFLTAVPFILTAPLLLKKLDKRKGHERA